MQTKTAYRKADVIAKFQARYDYFAAAYRALPAGVALNDYPSLQVAGSQMSAAWDDLQFIKRGTNWRLALPHTGAYPYTDMFLRDWKAR